MKKTAVLFLILFAALFLPVNVLADDSWMAEYHNPQKIEGTNYYLVDKYDVPNDAGETFYAMGVVDAEGNVILECKYFSIELSSEFAPVGNRMLISDLNRKHGFVDENFNIVIPLIYDDAGSFQEGVALVGVRRADGTMAISHIDIDGNMVTDIPATLQDENYYAYITASELGGLGGERLGNLYIIAMATPQDGKFVYGLADLYTHQWIVAPEWDSMFFSEKGQLWAVKELADARYDYWVLNPDSVLEHKLEFENIAYVDKEDYLFFYKNKESLIYDDAYGDYVERETFYFGLADPDGNIIIEPELEMLPNYGYYLQDGYLVAGKGSTQFYYAKGLGLVGNGKQGCVTKDGTTVIDFIYDELIYEGNHIFTAILGDVTTTIHLATDTNKEPQPTYSPWAKNSIERAIAENLVPAHLQDQYQNNITRGEFCHLAMQFYFQATGLAPEYILTELPMAGAFSDTEDEMVLAAYALEIVSGTGGGIFNPNGLITRQEAAVMLNNLFKQLDWTAPSLVDLAAYNDDNLIAGWAKASVYAISSLQTQDGGRVMGGTGGGNFSPLNYYTRQEAITTIVRLFDALSVE